MNSLATSSQNEDAQQQDGVPLEHAEDSDDPLPTGWHSASTEDGSVYYWSDTGGHQWERPTTHHSKDPEEALLDKIGISRGDLVSLDQQTLAVMRKASAFLCGNGEAMLPVLQAREVICLLYPPAHRSGQP